MEMVLLSSQLLVLLQENSRRRLTLARYVGVYLYLMLPHYHKLL